MCHTLPPTACDKHQPSFTPNSTHPLVGWIAIFGAITLLLLADVQEIEVVLEKVEWGTLVFFAGLFVLMELLAELGLINFIAAGVVWIIEVTGLRNA